MDRVLGLDGGPNWLCQRDAAWILAGCVVADNGVAHGIDDVDLIGKGTGDVRLCAVGRKGNGPWIAADGELFAQGSAGHIDD